MPKEHSKTATGNIDVMKLPRANISDYKSTQKVSESHTSVFSLFAGDYSQKKQKALRRPFNAF